LYIEELYNLYSSPNIIRQIKSRGMGWVERVARMGEEKMYSFGGKAQREETTRKTEV
jgi:hypothetical protein